VVQFYSIELSGLVLSNELCQTLCSNQKQLTYFKSENSQCDFEGGFVPKIADSCKRLRFLFIEGHFKSETNSSLSLVNQNLIVTLVADDKMIEGDDVKKMKKIVIQMKELVDVFNGVIERNLFNYSVNKQDDTDSDDDDDDVIGDSQINAKRMRVD
jgi:hypothetical protein